jgi:hypothetical protein
MSDQLKPCRTAARVIAPQSLPAGLDAAGVPGAAIPRLAKSLEIERSWQEDREAMLAAFRVALGLPRVPRSRSDGGER